MGQMKQPIHQVKHQDHQVVAVLAKVVKVVLHKVVHQVVRQMTLNRIQQVNHHQKVHNHLVHHHSQIS